MAKIIPASTIKHVRNAPGLTASQRASLKQSPAEKKARMASAQGRMGKVVSNFAKRQRGEKTPTGVGRAAPKGTLGGRLGALAKKAGLAGRKEQAATVASRTKKKPSFFSRFKNIKPPFSTRRTGRTRTETRTGGR